MPLWPAQDWFQSVSRRTVLLKKLWIPAHADTLSFAALELLVFLFRYFIRQCLSVRTVVSATRKRLFPNKTIFLNTIVKFITTDSKVLPKTCVWFIDGWSIELLFWLSNSRVLEAHATFDLSLKILFFLDSGVLTFGYFPDDKLLLWDE